MMTYKMVVTIDIAKLLDIDKIKCHIGPNNDGIIEYYIQDNNGNNLSRDHVYKLLYGERDILYLVNISSLRIDPNPSYVRQS